MVNLGNDWDEVLKGAKRGISYWYLPSVSFFC